MDRDQLQHYLPQVYQKGFVDPRGEVWRYDRLDGSVKHLPPKVIAAEINLYTVEREGVISQEIENDWFRLVDGSFAGIRSKVERQQALSANEARHLASFLAYLRVRTPAAIREVECTLRQYEQRLGDLDALPKPRPKEESGRLEPETYELITEQVDKVAQTRSTGKTRNEVMKLLISNGIHLARALLGLNWCLLSAPSGRSFIVGDNPFAIVPPAWHSEAEDGVGPTTPGATVFVPLTAKLCVRLSGEVGRTQRRRVDGSAVRAINALQVLNSERFVYGPSEPLLCKLISEFVNAPGLNHTATIIREAASTSNPDASLLHTFTRTKIPAQWANKVPLD